MRQTLADIYVSIEREYGTESIEWVLRKQQKVEFAAKLHRNEISVDNMVFMDNYYLSSIDILLLCEYYKIPLVLISANKINEYTTLELAERYIYNNINKVNEEKWNEFDKILISPIAETSDDIVILRQYGLYRNKPIEYSLVKSYNNKLRHSKDKLDSGLSNLIKKYLISQKVFEAKYVFEQMSKLVEFSINNNTTIYKLEKQLGKLKNDFRKNYDLFDKNIELNTVKEI